MANDEKAQLYKQIVTQTDEYTLLERMRELGFWPSGQGIPEDPQEELDEQRELYIGIDVLRKEAISAKDPEKALALERKRRWEESKLRRAAAAAEREAKRQERRKEWDAERSTTVVHAGLGVSAGLQGMGSDQSRLESLGLPVVHMASQLAGAMNIPLSKLRWLTYHRSGAAVVHYHRFEIPKKTGGTRLISAPKTALAQAQRWVLDTILSELDIEDTAHGFVRGRSIVTGAAPHAGRAVVINLDLKDFFPSITFRRVKGLFASFGYGEQVATVLALLCTEPPRVATELDGKIFHIALGQRQLPQGACTSPALTNLLCRKLDRRLSGLCAKLDFAYTRYADDLTLSGDDRTSVYSLLRLVRRIVKEEGFVENQAKTRVMHRGRRQEVTGLTVNETPNLSRKERRRLRAVLHNVARDGLEHNNRYDHPSFEAYLKGRVAFATMVDPERAPIWRSALDRALKK